MSDHEANQSDGIASGAYADSSVSLYTTLYGKDHIETVRSRLKLGKVYWMSSQFEEAYKLYSETLPQLESHKEEVDMELIDSQWTYGDILTDLERFAEADSLFASLYEQVVQMEFFNHATAGGIADARAYSMYLQLRSEESIEFLGQALEHTKREYGTNHIEVAVRLNNMAVVNRSTGNYDEALRLYEEALHVNKSLAFPDTFEIAMVLNNLSRLYATQQEYEQADQYIDEALTYKSQVIRLDSFQYGSYLLTKMEADLYQSRYETLLAHVSQARPFIFARRPPDELYLNRFFMFEVLGYLGNGQPERAYALLDRFSPDSAIRIESDVMSIMGTRILTMEAAGREEAADSLRSMYQARFDSTQIGAAPYIADRL